MERCSRCERTEEEIRLFDGFYGLEPVKICERCSLIANIPIVKRPSAEQLRISEKSYGVRDRLSVMAGLKLPEKKEKTVSQEMQKLNAMPTLEKPEDLVFKLVDNFHWVIQTQRRRKGYTVGQVAYSIGESESALKMLEKGIIPAKSLSMIEKIEQFLKISLIKKDSLQKGQEEINSSKKALIASNPPIVLRNPENNPLGLGEDNHAERIKKQEANEMVQKAILTEKNIKLTARERVNNIPLRIDDFRNDKLGGITVADLKKMEDKAEMDFEIEHLKSSAEIGREQVEGFGKESSFTSKKNSSVQKNNLSKKVPTIFDLMKSKSEKDRTRVTGNDILLEPTNTAEKIESAEEMLEKIETASGIVRRKRSFLSRVKRAIGFKQNEEKVDFETGKTIEYS